MVLQARAEQAASLLGQADLADAIDALRVHNGLPAGLGGIGVATDDLAATARASFGIYTTTEDIDALTGALREVVRLFGTDPSLS